ncbi:hypothetical protein BJY01DRAFT_252075 [Aspergillus pseudoustus]|uniref:BTB domain-containing protein n=1 Tax=Aspergillus pseudoustus TaxID=1810923 RepID=A0ABR4J879_9EURO
MQSVHAWNISRSLCAYLKTEGENYTHEPIEDFRRLDIISQTVYSHFSVEECYQLLASETPTVILVAHKRLLYMHSTYFASLSSGPWTNSDDVDFGAHISPPVLLALLDYVYSENYEDMRNPHSFIGYNVRARRGK